MAKWPRLVVVPGEGRETVTREQANEILVRTDCRHLAAGDGALEREVREALGHPHPDRRAERGPGADAAAAWTREEREWAAGLRMLDLRFLANSRILSVMIGGPHGWCDWDGAIGCSEWNIGKGPAAGEVTEDWAKIADAFPYLDLRAQCIADDGRGEVAAQWRVSGGKAAPVKPGRRYATREFTRAELAGAGELGVRLERLREAVEQVRGAA